MKRKPKRLQNRKQKRRMELGGTRHRTVDHRRLRLEALEPRWLLDSDFGDAPDPYPVLLADGGAEHVAIGATLGAERDSEPDGQRSASALGDDSQGVPDDEDGVTAGSLRAGQLGATVAVTVQNAPSGARLDAWIDFNRDGNWGGPWEHVADSVAVANGANAISFDVPAESPDGTTYARFRLSSAGGLAVTGAASDGEVEDHALTLAAPARASGVFGGKKVIGTAGDGPESAAAADLDGDGDLDVLSASSTDGKVIWYENMAGDGSTFSIHVITSTAVGADSVAAADVDGDGDLDGLSASYGDDTIAWYENTLGDASAFATHVVSVGYADGPESVAAGDIDGDGDLDILSASNNDDRIAWYENTNGDGSAFLAHEISTTADYVRCVVTADIDRDGDLDVLSASWSDSTIAWYENTAGDGSAFAKHLINTAASGAISVAAADLDQDGDLDVLSASYYDNTIAWYENTTGSGSSFTKRVISSAAYGARWVSTADLDGDGDLDVLSGSRDDNKVAWYENLAGNASVFATHVVATAANSPEAVFGGDMDGDGDLDIISATFNDDTMAWYENPWYESSHCDFGDAPAPYPTLLADEGARHVNTGMLLGVSRDEEPDGQPDAAARGDDNGGLSDEDGVALPLGWLDRGETTSLRVTVSAAAVLNVWIDWNDDGDWSDSGEQVFTDQVVAAGANRLIVNVPATATLTEATFARFRVSTKGGLSFTGLAVDGEVEDYAVAIREAVPYDFGDAPAPYPTLLGDNGARHAIAGPYLGTAPDAEADGQPQAGAAGDDNNGSDDEDGATFGTIRVGQLAAPITVNVQQASSGARLDAWIDFNQDGSWGGPAEQIAASLAVVNGPNSVVFDVPADAVAGTAISRFRLSTAGGLGPAGQAADGEVEDHVVTLLPPALASGVFQTRTGVPTTAENPGSVALADVDGDGDLDVLSASFNDDRIAWSENTAGDGSVFTAHTVTANADGACSVSAADIDGDGDVDVLSASSNDDRIAWYENTTGIGSTFTMHTVTLVADGASWVAAADLDEDGDLDILSASGFDRRIVWYENAAGNGSAFVAHTISTAGSEFVASADMDGDGDMDVLSASPSYNTIAWYENPAADGAAFTQHIISVSTSSARSAIAADLDGDGDLDVLAGLYGAKKVVWFENTLGDGSVFSQHDIAAVSHWPTSVAVGDIDGDGDLDPVVTVPYGEDFIWFENNLNHGSAFVTHITSLPYAVGPQQVAVGDLDTDGDLDLLGSFYNPSFIEWYQNLDLDFGDAPAPYPTLASADGARHADTGPLLGSRRDTERDGQPDAAAIGDDNQGLDDEDGVVLPLWLTPGTTADVAVTVASPVGVGGTLNAWIDFNDDGDWTDSGEQVADDQWLPWTTSVLSIPVPADATLTPETFARFRLSNYPVTSPTGFAQDGEVEDYALPILVPPPGLTVLIGPDVLSERDAWAATTATLARSEPWDTALTVTLTSSDTSEVYVPATVTIPAGYASVTFAVDVVNDGEVDGSQNVTVTAAAPGWPSGEDSVTIADDDTQSQRNLCGPLSGTLAQGDYLVPCDLGVPRDATLTVSPGTRLRFAAGTEAVIDGQLLAEAVPGAEIRFTSAAATPAPGDWKGIRFENTYQPGSMMHFVEVAYANVGVGLWTNGPRLTVSHADVHHSLEQGVYLSAAYGDSIGAGAVLISDSRIHDNGKEGILLGARTSGGSPNSRNYATVSGNEVFDNGGSGIRIFATYSRSAGTASNAFAIPEVTGNYVHHNGLGLVAAVYVDSGAFGTAGVSGSLANNLVVANLSHGMQLVRETDKVNSLGIQAVNNTLAGNGGAGIYHDGLDQAVVQNNIVVGNATGLEASIAVTPAAGQVGYNDVWQNAGGNWINYPASFGDRNTVNARGTLADAELNISEDPQFAAADFHLRKPSLAVNAGTAANAPAVDFDGASRILPIDIGCDEVTDLPVVTVQALTTNDTTPAITGTVSEGTLQVVVNGKTYAAGDGNLTVSGTDWTLQIPAGDELPWGTYNVLAAATDAAGNVGRDNTTDELRIVKLIVTSLTPTVSGFVARFSGPVEPSVLNLYDSAAGPLGPADVILVGVSTGLVPGSILLGDSNQELAFVATGGLLAADTYTVTFRSSADGFREPGGGLLDGNRDGVVGDDFSATLTSVHPPAGTVTLRLPDFARGAGQSVNIPNAAAGLPLRIDDAAGVTSLAVDLMYDPTLLTMTAATLTAGLPGDWSVTLDTSTSGVAQIRASGTPPLSGTNVDIVRLTAALPGGAAYGAIQAIRLENVSLNGGTIAAIGDVAVHKAAYLGDADGSGIHSSADAFLTVQAALGLASGFAAHAWTDPRIVGDADVSGVLSAADAFLIVQEGLGLVEPFVPDNPHITVTPVGGGVDPQFQIDANLPASAGGLVTVPVKLAIEPAATNVGAFDFDLFFDPARLTIQLPGGVASGADTAGWAVSAILVAPGHLRVGMVSWSGQPLAPGLREIVRLRYRVAAGESSRMGWQPVPDGLPIRPTSLRRITDHRSPISDASDGSETHPAWLDIEPVDAGAGGYTWTDADGSVLIRPAERTLAAAARERVWRDVDAKADLLENVLADLVHDLATAWR